MFGQHLLGERTENFMMCPRCNEGILQKIQVKDTGERAFLCDTCEGLWFEDEEIKQFCKRTLSMYGSGNDLEYGFSELDEKDQDHRVESNEKKGALMEYIEIEEMNSGYLYGYKRKEV